MARFNQARTNFLGGEITPKAYARTDLQSFSQSCEQLQNMYVYPQGGAARRPGTVYMSAATADLAANGYTSPVYGTRLIPFILSNTEAYMLAFVVGHTNPTVYTQDGTVLTPAYNSSVLPTSAKRWPGVANESELYELQFQQINDYIVILHPKYPPVAFARTAVDLIGGTITFQKLHWYDFGNWSNGPSAVRGAGWSKGVAYRDINATGTTITPSGTTGTITLTGSVAIFDAGMIGSFFKITNAGSTATGFVIITAVASATSATAVTIVNLGDTTATPNWYEGAWSDYRGWPRTLTYFEQRLIFMGNVSQPGTLWASQVGDIGEYMAPTPSVNSDAFTMTIAGENSNKAQWLLASKNLNIGTAGQEYLGGGTDAATGLGPQNLGFSPQSNHGSAYVQAVRIDSTPIFVQRSGANLLEIVFNLQEDNYKAENVSIYADHLRPQNQLCVQQDRGIIWAKRYRIGAANQNQFMGLTRDRTTQVKAFHSHILGGDTSAKILSMAVLPAPNGFADQLWFAVLRNYTSGSIVTLEKLSLEIDPDLGMDDLISYASTASNFGTNYCPSYSDCSIIKAVTALDLTITGLPDVYNGQQVDVRHVTKGYLGRFTVTANTITLVTEISATGYVVIGFPYTSVLATTELDVGGIFGSSVGVPKKVDKATINFNRTLGAQFGSSLTNLEDINFRDGTVAAGTQTPLFSGYQELVFPAGWKHKQQVFVRQDYPFPLTVLGITYRGAGND